MRFIYTSLATAGFVALSAAQTWPYNLIGTWSTKSNKTLTGPGFYDPLNDNLIEPERTGISYSFTGDGHYEEAYYRAISNPTNPSCPGGIMQWQHGTWVLNANNTLSLTPIDVDGRQLLSQPCSNKNSIYTRYNQSEEFVSYEVLTDPYHNIPRLNLNQFDGTPLQPMYLVFSPPQMLPTTTLNPVTATATPTTGSKVKRGLNADVPLAFRNKLQHSDTRDLIQRIDVDRLWWIGVGMTGFGTLLYFGPRRMGIRV